MQLTKVYETSDGKLFRSRKTARRHEAWLELVDLCASSKYGDLDALAEWLCSRSTDLQKLLKAEPCNEPASDDDEE